MSEESLRKVTQKVQKRQRVIRTVLITRHRKNPFFTNPKIAAYRIVEHLEKDKTLKITWQNIYEQKKYRIYIFYIPCIFLNTFLNQYTN